MQMKYNAINLIRRGADALQQDGDGGSAYALHELANNMILLMTGAETLEAWNGVYTTEGTGPLDLDKHLPIPDDEAA